MFSNGEIIPMNIIEQTTGFAFFPMLVELSKAPSLATPYQNDGLSCSLRLARYTVVIH